MPEPTIQTHVFENGLVLAVQPMPDVQSAAFSLLTPGGSAYDPPGQNGTAAVLCELITRGAGQRDARQLAADLDDLGVHRSESVRIQHLSFSGATLASNIGPALEIYADIVRRPHLPSEQFEAARAGVSQTLQALDDEPRQKTMIELRRRCYGAPWNAPTDGTLEELGNIDHALVKSQYERCLGPDGTIIGVAGRVVFEEVRELVGRLFGDWPKQQPIGLAGGEPGPRLDHINQESTQTHIGIAYEAVPYRDEDYFKAWAAVGVLSGGMSSRLFTEVREKRGLCYSVYATLHTLPHEGRVLCYAGTTAERAQETLDVTLAELARLEQGIEPSELDRQKARGKSSLIMQQESTMARASAIARDWFHLGRVMPLDEVRRRVEALSVDDVLDYVRRHPARDFTILTLGPKPLEVQGGVS